MHIVVQQIFTNFFHLAELKLYTHWTTIPFTTPSTLSNHYLCFLRIWLLEIVHISRIMWYLLFCDQLISLSLTSRFICAVVYGRFSSLFKAEYDWVICICCILFICLSTYGSLGCFHPLDALDMQTSLWVPALNLLDIHPEVELGDHMVIPF